MVFFIVALQDYIRVLVTRKTPMKDVLKFIPHEIDFVWVVFDGHVTSIDFYLDSIAFLIDSVSGNHVYGSGKTYEMSSDYGIQYHLFSFDLDDLVGLNPFLRW